jgi:hypothetical protein
MPHELLVTAAELPQYGLDASFIESFDEEIIEANLQAVTDEALGRMAPTVTPPITAWGADIKGACARIAVYELKSLTGLAPVQSAVGDENLLVRAQQARDYLDAIGQGKIQPIGLVDSSADGEAGGVIVAMASDDQRGW